MKYIFFCWLLGIFLWVLLTGKEWLGLVIWNFLVGCLEFPCGFLSTEKEWPGLVAWNFPDGSSPTWKFNKPSGIKKPTAKLLFPCRYIPEGYSLSVYTRGNYFSIFLSVFCISLWVCAPSRKFWFPVVYTSKMPVRCYG